ncbi:Transaminase AMT5 [Pseudocercospora fuligena]|uniref:Transaminase AMT5 n=1 Tax=Pseudocercospora fuligena TaxID=685502 RepID=A0A8H6RBL6_9PEZI|nr:Transaminase AMT5 [Pseudocercospora fuligena]
MSMSSLVALQKTPASSKKMDCSSKLQVPRSVVNGHAESTFSTGRGAWSDPIFVQDPYLRVHGLAPALNYSQQIFEGMKAFMTWSGELQIFRPQQHAARFARSALEIGIPPVPENLFLQAVHMAVSLNKQYVPPYGHNGAALYIRPLAFASGPSVNLSPSEEYTFCVYVLPVPGLSPNATIGLKALVMDDSDRVATLGTGHVKVGGNYATSTAIMTKTKAQGYDLSLYLDSMTHNFIDEFSTSAFVAVQTRPTTTLIVADAPSILPSIIVDSLCELARSQFGWAVIRRRIPFDEIETFDEVFAVGTAFIATPIRSITRLSTTEHIQFVANYQAEDSVYAQLTDALQKIQHNIIEDRWGWMVKV